MFGVARPVRTEARSSLATETAFSIFSSASKSVSSITACPCLPAQTRSFQSGVLTRVPILSPRTARAMFPSTSRLNTMIGILLSMQRLNAVASATFRPCSSTSRWVISSYSLASGSTLGSAVKTPSTPLASSTTSAPISSARCAPAVSVEKYGMPTPAPKITTRPFSRCRMARRGM